MKNTLLLIAALVGLATAAFSQNVNQVNDAAKIVLPNGIATGEPPLTSLARGVLSQDGSLVFRAVGDTLVFEGATTDRFDTTFAITDPTANRTITFPNSSGTVLLTAIDQWVFEGATANAYETTVDAVDPTADGTIWLPDTGVGIADANLSFFVSEINSGLNAPGLATSVWSAANAVRFEGATADAHEATIDAADATADTIFRLPVAAAGTYSLFTSTLATNAPDIASSVTGASNSLVWEGSTADTSEIVLDAADAGADVIYRLPTAAAGTYGVFSTSLATNQIDIAASVTGTSNGLVAEGATADAFETTLAFADATADTTATIPAKVVSGTVEVLSVQAEPATDTITAGQLYGGVIVNTGAVGAAVYTLPAPVVGMHFRVYLNVAQDVDINPADGTQILALTNAAGDAISSAATIGNCIELIAISTTEWVALAVSGTWSDAN